MNTLTVKQTLTTHLDAYLGTYTLPGAKTIKSIHIGDRPSDYTLDGNGIEVLVQRNLERSNTALLGGGAISTKNVVVYFVDRIGADDANYVANLEVLETVLDTVTSLYPDCQFNLLAGDEAAGIAAQAVVRIPTYQHVKERN